MGGNLHGIEIVNDSMYTTSKAQATNDKIDKSDFIKIKNFCTSKDTY